MPPREHDAFPVFGFPMRWTGDGWEQGDTDDADDAEARKRSRRRTTGAGGNRTQRAYSKDLEAVEARRKKQATK